jgi:hypothetical protein
MPSRFFIDVPYGSITTLLTTHILYVYPVDRPAMRLLLDGSPTYSVRPWQRWRQRRLPHPPRHPRPPTGSNGDVSGASPQSPTHSTGDGGHFQSNRSGSPPGPWGHGKKRPASLSWSESLHAADQNDQVRRIYEKGRPKQNLTRSPLRASWCTIR